ncbi:MAG: chemotaxis protein CheA [Acidobacteriota bacterium]
MEKYLGLFVSEAREHLEEAAEALDRLSESPDDLELLNLLFRHGHSIKGMAASMGFEPIARVSHALEDRFDDVRKGRAAVTPDLVRAALDAVEALSEAVDVVEAGGEMPASLARVAASLREAAPAAREEGQAASPSADPGAGWVYNVEIRIDPASPMPAARAVVLHKKLESLGKIVFARPDREQLVREPFDGSLLAQFSSTSSEGYLRAELEGLPEIASVVLTRFMSAADAAGAGAAPATRPAGPPQATQPPPPATVRIQTDTLDRFVDHLGELIILGSRLENALGPSPGREAGSALDALRKTLAGLREDLMGLRMVPFEHIAARFVRSVRNLAGNLDKRVAFSIQGREVKLDRSMLEELVDPINHILRNAVDHGIETPEERERAGKEPIGQIVIRNTEHSDSVTIEIEDDGRGMDPGGIRRAAIERGFLSREQGGALSDAEALMLVTTPGFSTAERLTEISGRGVGMDVVRTRIESLGGRLRISSSPGGGTRIRLRLPFTVAVIHAFLVRSREGTYAVPVSSVRRTFEADPARVQRLGSTSVISLDGETVQLIRLDRLTGDRWGRSRGEERPGRHLPAPALLFHRDERPMGLVVDAILGKRDIVVKPLRSPLEHLRAYTGATLLEDGSIAMILDVRNLATAHPAEAAGGTTP